MVSSNNIDMRDAFFEPLVEIALKNKNIIILSADHAAFSLIKFQKEAQIDISILEFLNKI